MGGGGKGAVPPDFNDKYKQFDFQTGMPTSNSVISVLTGDNSALCGVRYTIGETYLIVGKCLHVAVVDDKNY